MRSKAPTRLGEYELLGALARGQSYVLQLARSVSASGVLPLRALKIPVDGNAGPAMLAELVGEASLLARLRHPSVVTAHGVSREHGGYLVLDYIEGDDLESLLLGGAPDPRVAAAIFADVLAALDVLHNAVDELGAPLRAVHQAAYARHIVVGTDGVARLVDFSNARTARMSTDARRVHRLAMASLAPEQILAPHTVDARADLFVLATSFWEALTGLRLFAAATPEQLRQQVLTRRVFPPSATGRSAVAAFDEVCLRGLTREPDQRWQTAHDMRAALLEAGRALGGAAERAEVARWVGMRAANLLDVRRALAARGSPADAEPVSVAESASASGSSALGKEKRLADDGGATPRFRPMRPASSRPPAAASSAPPPLPAPAAPRASVRPRLRLAVVEASGAEREQGQAHRSPPEQDTASQPTQCAEPVASAPEPLGPKPHREPTVHAVAREQPGQHESGSAARTHPASSPQTVAAAPPTPRPVEADRPASGAGPHATPRPVEPPPRRSSRPTRQTPRSVPAADEAGRPSKRQIAWMFAVVLGSVVLGEAVLRVWFHSPYGEPAPRPLENSALQFGSEGSGIGSPA